MKGSQSVLQWRAVSSFYSKRQSVHGVGWGGGVLQNPCTLPSFIGEKVSGRGTGGGGGDYKKTHLHSPVIWRRESERESSRLINVPSKCQDRQHCWRAPEV